VPNPSSEKGIDRTVFAIGKIRLNERVSEITHSRAELGHPSTSKAPFTLVHDTAGQADSYKMKTSGSSQL
jgi:hypothetical protein